MCGALCEAVVMCFVMWGRGVVEVYEWVLGVVVVDKWNGLVFVAVCSIPCLLQWSRETHLRYLGQPCGWICYALPHKHGFKHRAPCPLTPSLTPAPPPPPSPQVLFVAGQPSDSGIFIVVRGSLGVFLDDAGGGPPIHANTLRYGESVGDLDVVDGAPRSVSCIALGEGALLVQVRVRRGWLVGFGCGLVSGVCLCLGEGGTGRGSERGFVLLWGWRVDGACGVWSVC